MLRINLLPPYVQQRRLTKKLVPVFVGLFLLSVALPLILYSYLHGKLTTLTQEASDAVAGKAKTDNYKSEAATTISQVAPIQAKLKFVTDADAYARKWVALYNTLADTTPKSSFLYTGAAVTGQTMAIRAYSPSVEEVGRYLQVMYHEPDFTSVVVDKIPAYPENIRHLYFYNGTLVFADGATGGGGGNASSAFSGSRGGAPGGFPGGGGGFPGGGGGFPGGGGSQGGGGQATTGAPANYTPEALGPNGAANLPSGVGPPPPEIAVGGTGGGTLAGRGGGGVFGGRGGNGAPGGFPGAGGGGQSTTYSENFLRVAGRGISPFASPTVRDLILQKALRRVVVKTVPKGFDINVTAMLKEALTPPELPGGAPAAGAAGLGGGPPGGFPGAPPGGSPGGGPPGYRGGGPPRGPGGPPPGAGGGG